MHIRRESPGFTVVELVAATAILMILSLAVTQLSITGQDAHRYSKRLGRITEVTQRMTDSIRRDLRAAIRLFGNDALGLAYRARLQPWFGFEPIRSTRLPVIQSAVGFGKDTPGAEKTGNELLFARHAWSDVYECASGKSYRVDILRIQRFYLKVEGRGPGQPGGALNVCKWTSEPLASASQVAAIADPADRREVLVHLLNGSPDKSGDEHDPVQVVWKFAEDPAATGTFRQIQMDGSLSDSPLAPRPKEWQVARAEHMSSPGLFFPNEHTVAANQSPVVHGVSRFAIRDDSAGMGAGFPHGLEFQIAGPSAARKVLLHLTTVSTNNQGLKAQFDTQMVTNVREG